MGREQNRFISSSVKFIIHPYAVLQNQLPISNCIHTFWRKRGKRILNEILLHVGRRCRYAILIALEQITASLYGEFEIHVDIGIFADGKIKFFELHFLNSCYFKKDYSKTVSKEIKKLFIQFFAIFLGNFIITMCFFTLVPITHRYCEAN